MEKITPRLPSGMRDFLPEELLRRQFVIERVARVFEAFGYEPLQTPVLELEETLLGKYGADAEKLIFHAQHPNGKEKLALRYDLTVPLARAFALHESKLSLPFRRYQIAPVWRAERPQRGRYREFYQCDVDCIGVEGMEADAEVISVAVMALQRLGFSDFAVKLNNRKLLTGIGLYVGLEGPPLADLYRSIDKLDKIGVDGVREELLKSGIAAEPVDRIMALVGSGAELECGYAAARARLAHFRQILSDVPLALEGLAELERVFNYLEASQVPEAMIAFDPSMVRGLGYYTGPIFEAVLLSADPEERVGSLAGGGRYDDLIGLFRKTSLPTVGVSLGIERLIVLMEKRGMYPEPLQRTVVQVLVSVFNEALRPAALRLASQLRLAGLSVEVFAGSAKLGKQLAYADKRGIPLVALLGEDELAAGVVKFKRLRDQHETVCPSAESAQQAQALLCIPQN
ncbi:MAG: histidine--tRNA ligase [Candidatus Thermofonsia Clade 1 bacterium]|uniref:Histidine--tRNA ligase n=2 Tax=Candidatus Thermofonsia Clade 1 bacterium TaxID=2364210 RepID=A0A2M8PXX6_9CHLR|nr:MAG: histidine--tRNA ligase [Candidatus Thermofonsia Clade 1 bacterium]